ncbi:FAD-dependent oxidoreductase [Sinorhizobium americanum]|uniref:FAD binding domain-containing protein n=1 Tax=Sinorhizobium americanum TaxID=194963 RepID=A0A4R2B6B4_9HYPH|nr:FAD-dependent oxidoreductase [Sinorhizobium americanum]TCN22106.1 FAD binding domain-containing protein [Sinorhizobium americanum]
MRSYDVIVLGSGGAGLVAALAAADQGLSVGVFEKSHLIGGTTAISGGGIWIPNNHIMAASGYDDDEGDAKIYLDRLTLGETPSDLLQAFLKTGPEMLRFIERRSPLRFFSVDRPDYHPGWPGAKTGRSVEPLPFEPSMDGSLFRKLRYSTLRQPVTSTEAKKGISAHIVADRQGRNIRTQGAGLVAGLAQACAQTRVDFHLSMPATGLSFNGRHCLGIETAEGSISANIGVILATGGFEWNRDMVAAFLPGFTSAATTPPGNDGDGLRFGLEAGAAVANMTEAWWTAAYQIPGEQLDGKPLTRNIVRELALPGSIMVNSNGKRFVNEATSYNDLGMAFNTFDPGSFSYLNRPAWLIFDHAFKNRYTVASIPPTKFAPSWMHSAASLTELADKLSISSEGLRTTVARFNEDALEGRDRAFRRGEDAHGLYYGDPTVMPNACLGPVSEGPFYAVEILPGNNGTKGGLTTTAHGQVMHYDGTTIGGLYACGNVAASIFGKGYPGHGGSLGPILAAAYAIGVNLGTNGSKKTGDLLVRKSVSRER